MSSQPAVKEHTPLLKNRANPTSAMVEEKAESNADVEVEFKGKNANGSYGAMNGNVAENGTVSGKDDNDGSDKEK